jgi:hypothetical protein
MPPLRLWETSASVFLTENCNVHTEVTIITIQNSDHWLLDTFITFQLRSDLQIVLTEVVQQLILW